MQGARATASFEVAMDAFAEAGFSPAEAFSAVKAASYLALMIGTEQSMAARGQVHETQLEDLPVESFPRVRSVAADVGDVGDHEYVWAFAVETLVAGLRSRLQPDRR